MDMENSVPRAGIEPTLLVHPEPGIRLPRPSDAIDLSGDQMGWAERVERQSLVLGDLEIQNCGLKCWSSETNLYFSLPSQVLSIISIGHGLVGQCQDKVI